VDGGHAIAQDSAFADADMSRTANPSLVAREQALSGFFEPLEQLCRALPALAAAIVDPEGETVDFAGSLDAYATKLAAAELQLIVAACRGSRVQSLNSLNELVVRARHATLAAIPLGPDYILIVHLPRRAFTLSHRALSEAVRRLCVEGEFPVPPRFRDEQWMRVAVKDDRSVARRPLAICAHSRWDSLDVLGRVHQGGLREGEIGYRIQLQSGQEATLVREPLGKWFSDRLLAP
jgi:hypothetical protein